MDIYNEEIWRLVLMQQDVLIPTGYCVYKTTSNKKDFIAEGRLNKEALKTNEEPKQSLAVQLVKKMFEKASASLGRDMEINKTAIESEVENSTGKKVKVYFLIFNDFRVVCTSVKSDLSVIPIHAK